MVKISQRKDLVVQDYIDHLNSSEKPSRITYSILLRVTLQLPREERIPFLENARQRIQRNRRSQIPMRHDVCAQGAANLD